MTRSKNVIAASDVRTAKALYAQIQANRASFDPQYRLAHEPSGWRIDHLRYACISHPKQHLQPKFDPERSPSILPAIHLYMHFLDCALPIFHTLLLREPALFLRETPSEPRVWLYPEPLLDLTAEQKSRTWTSLGEIGKEVVWVVGVADEDGLKPRDEGMTYSLWDRPLHDTGLAGHGSRITTNLTMMQAVENSANSEDQKLHMFNLAVLWLHEMAHAVANAVLPWTAATGRQELFVGPRSSTSEDGFEVEDRLFGGRFVECHKLILNTPMVLQEWPDVVTLRSYQKSGEPILTRGTSERLTREWTVEWKVEPNYWKRMFEEDFWRNDLMVGRSNALWPAKNVGVLRKFVSRALTEEEEETLEREMEIEGYERRRNDLFVRKGLVFEMEAMYESDGDETDDTDSDGIEDVEMGELEDTEMTEAD
ncbi:hypothetical protein TI39_contig403g00002 [Zymoseptoria brevis]|uniref:Uncharacterized protein n=1 Tax=Zymoseptoria brevis TaxID=1047168 RepID=A0A0F4GNE5_9PEZI|nr:hypothetical protein TI39_contig403g00002 [Zymoseptoria brevis]